MSEFQSHQQVILRLPESVADRVNRMLHRSLEPVHIEVVPEVGKKAMYKFVFGEESLPALLGNLPCNVETHKTFDHRTYYKSADIGQMLVVFENESEREKADESMVSGEFTCFNTGVTPPSHCIVTRKFNKTRHQKPHPPDEVSKVENELCKYVSADDTEEIFEEVVDFEDYMADRQNPEGKTFTLNSHDFSLKSSLPFQLHPERGEGKQVRSKEGDGDEGGYGTGFDDKDLDGDEGNEEDGSNQSACSSDSSESDDAWLNDLENSIETKET